MKKIVLFFCLIALMVTLVFLPVVPQAMPYEALTEEGGFYGVDYEFSSLRGVIVDLNCHLNCFPHNSDTRRFNLIAMIVSSLVIIATFGYLTFRIFRKHSR